MTKVLALERLIEKYRRMPGTVFPYHCRYSDTGIAGEQRVTVAVGDAGDAAAEGQDVVSLPLGEARDRDAVGVSVDEQPGREGKSCALRTGREIADALTALRTSLGDHRFAPPGEAARTSRAPCFELVGSAEEPSPAPLKSTCPRADTCPVAGTCVTVNGKLSLQGLRVGANRPPDVRALQSLLFMLQFGEEMRFERYGTDGVLGERTRLALEAFVRERAISSGSPLPAARVERVDSAIGAALVECCTSGWTRPRYYDLADDDWNLAPTLPAGELGWLRRRHHVRCLQEDLVTLRIETADLRAARRSLPLRQERFEQRWVWGVFDAVTETAVKVFQATASTGGRLNPVTKEIDFSARRVSFHGEVSGVADRETRAEVKRWIAYLHTRGPPDAALPIAEVLHPALGCPAVAKEQGTFEVMFSVPIARIPADGLTPQALEDVFTLHLPRDPEAPFRFDSCPPAGVPVAAVSVLKVERVEKPEEDAGLHAGTTGLKSSATCVHSPGEPWLECVDGAARETTAGRVIALYDRAYPGPTDGGARAIFRAQVKLSPSTPAGLYLLHVRGHPARHAMPVRVFERDRSTYRIAHVSDLHLSARDDELERYLHGTAYQNPSRSARELIELLNAERPDLVIMTGDLVDSAHKHRPIATRDGKLAFVPADIDASWRAFHAMVTGALQIPFFTLLGERDRTHNPPSVVLSSAPLGISRFDADAYPLDGDDVADEEFGFPRSWITARARADSFHADDGALEFYFQNVNPFSRYNFLLDNILFCCVDTGKSRVDSLTAYGPMSAEQARSRLASMIEAGPPIEPCAGITNEVVGWIGQRASATPGCLVVLCMHAPPLLFPVSDIELSVPAGTAPPSPDDGSEAALVRAQGLLTAPGWGAPDLLETRGWYSEEVATRLEGLVPAGPRDWIPIGTQDRAFLEEKTRVVSGALAFFSSLLHPPEPCAGACVAPTEAHEAAGCRIPEGQCPRALAIELDGLLGTLTRLLSVSVDHHGLASGGERLLSLFENGTVRLVLHGHLHRNRVMTCVGGDGRVHWKMTPRSGEEASVLAEAEPACRHVGTVSCGHAGTSYVGAGEGVARSFDRKGFRVLVFTDGRLLSWKDRSL